MDTFRDELGPSHVDDLIDRFRRAVERVSPVVGIAAMLRALSLLALAEGRLDDANEILTLSVRAFQDALAPDDPRLVPLLSELAAMAEVLGAGSSALAIDRQVEAIRSAYMARALSRGLAS